MLEVGLRPSEHCILLDTSWLIHKCYHAMPKLHVTINNEEVRTGHFYGLGRIIITILDNYDSRIVMCLDGNPSAKRDKLGSYKEGRQKSFNLRQVSIESAKMFSALPGVYAAASKGAEADEVIYSLSKSGNGLYTILTGDNDLLQAWEPGRVTIARSIKKDSIEYVTEEYVNKRFGVPVEKLLLYRVLAGDKSDNIAGILKPSEARKLILNNEITSEDDLINYPFPPYISKSLIKRNIDLMKLKPISYSTYKQENIMEALNIAERYKLKFFIDYIKRR